MHLERNLIMNKNFPRKILYGALICIVILNDLISYFIHIY